MELGKFETRIRSMLRLKILTVINLVMKGKPENSGKLSREREFLQIAL